MYKSKHVELYTIVNKLTDSKNNRKNRLEYWKKIANEETVSETPVAACLEIWII